MGYSLIKEGEPFERDIGDFLLDWLNMENKVSVGTSGSTGEPKALLLEKRGMVNSARATGIFFGLRPKDRALLCLSAQYIAGKMMLVRAMVLGLHLDYVEPGSKPLQGIRDRYTFAAMVPLQLENSLEKIDQVKTLIVGGAAFPVHLKERLGEKTTAIYETYGMTETITHIAVRKINNTRRSGSEVRVEPNVPFTTLPDILLSKDLRGCLVIDAPEIVDAPVVTNDLVDLISETRFEWLGRYDNVINSGGIKLHPEQIEAKFASTMESRFMVAGLPDDRLGQKLVLIIEGEMDLETLGPKLAMLPTVKKVELPKEMYALPKFVETQSGKIHRGKTLAAVRRGLVS